MRIIAKHIYKKQVKSAGFVTLVLAPILFIGIILVIGYFTATSQGTSNNNIMIVTDSSEVVETLRATDTNNSLEYTTNLNQAQEALRNQVIDGYATVELDNASIEAEIYVPTTNDDLDLTSEENALNMLRQSKSAAEMGIDAGAIQDLLLNNVTFQRNNVTISDSGEITSESTDITGRIIKTAIAYGIVFMLFMVMIFYIQIIAEELAKEKGTRVMEIILSSMSASSHFYGKILGILMMLLTHVSIYAILILIAILLNNQFNWIDLSMLDQFGINIGSLIQDQLPMIAWTLAFAVAGLLIYLALTGFFASLATKSEDAQKLNTPMTLTMVIGLYIGMFALNSPYNSVVKITSYIPFWTPFIMPFRIAADSVTQTQLIISLVVAFVFALLCFRFATVFYKSNVLTYSDKGIMGRIRQSYNLLKSERLANKE